MSTGIATGVATSTMVRPVRFLHPLPQRFYDQCIPCNNLAVVRYPLGEEVISFKRDKKSDMDDCIGLIGRGSDMLSFVNEAGDYYCMPKSNSAYRTLVAHGYNPGNLEVLLQVGHTILDTVLQERFQTLNRQCLAHVVAI